MATVNFRIKGTDKTARIKVRFKQGDQFDYELSTGLEVNRKHWSNKQQIVKNLTEATYRDALNKKLNELKTHIINSYYDASSSNSKISQVWLKERVSEFLNEPLNKGSESKIYFTPFIENYIKDSRKFKTKNSRKPLSERTLSTYETTLKKLKEYEVAYGLKLKLSDIDLTFHSKFKLFLSEELLLNPNTIGSYFSRIKLFCNQAEIQGLKVSREIKSRNFFSPQNTTNDVYLNKKEVELIFDYTFDSERLDNARDWLIIGLWTGLRVSDLLVLTEKNIKGRYIHKTTFKTNTPVIIPIHPHVDKTLAKHNNNFPRQISEQKFNQYIKEVCFKVGITELTEGSKMVATELNGKTIYRKKHGIYPKFELVSTHTCRRSFATNLYGTIETMVIMKITGHSTEKMLQNYLKKTSMEYAVKLDKMWNK